MACADAVIFVCIARESERGVCPEPCPVRPREIRGRRFASAQRTFTSPGCNMGGNMGEAREASVAGGEGGTSGETGGEGEARHAKRPGGKSRKRAAQAQGKH
jgi:hypothetical protein